MNNFIQAHIEACGGFLSFTETETLVSSLVEVFDISKLDAEKTISEYYKG